MKKVITTIAAVAVSLLSLLVILFVVAEYKATEIPEKQCKIAEGVVTEIVEGGIKDVVITLGGEKKFYINRGLESTFELNNLQDEVVGKKVIISYSDHNSILGSKDNSIHHIRNGNWSKDFLHRILINSKIAYNLGYFSLLVLSALMLLVLRNNYLGRQFSGYYSATKK